ncbi:ATP-binding protein [Planobispora longispora]|uniref:histidine kinase n=1 Tax=Planobispora longispora TaxID=28887 RepID=A0A8J3W5M7_9ACTN|nr:ATP-binding protein [Planobispora longispora]GIH76730.1 hypothetical protein Plo01_31590 [Planobispora longispora]
MRSRAGHGVDRSRAARGPHAGGEHADDDAGVRLQQTFLQALLDSMSSGVAACDADGRMVVFNQSMRQSRPSVPGLHVRDVADAFHLYAADGRSPLQPDQVPLARALGGERVDGEHVIVRLPGTPERRFSVTARPVDAPDGQRLGAMAVMDDITQVHRAQVLRAAQHAVVEALAASPSAEQAATDVVAAVTAALGWRCGEYWEVGPDQSVITRLGAWTAPSRDLSAFLAARPQAMRPGQGVAGTAWAGRRALWVSDLGEDLGEDPDDDLDGDPAAGPAGDRRAVVARGQALAAGLRAAIGLPVRSGAQVLGVLVFFTDTVQEPDEDLVSMLDGVCAHVGRYVERRRAEELALALAASRRQFDRVVSHITDNVWTAEVLDAGTTRSVYQSQNAAPILGRPLPPQEDLAQVMAERVHPEDRAAYAAFVRELCAGEHPVEIECRILGLDERTRWVWIRAIPRHEGDRLFVDGISTDITERHQLADQRERLLDQQQRQVRQLQELDRMKDELMALVTHELRNPIGAIRGYAEMLTDDPELSHAQRAFVEVIDRKSAHLQRLVDDLLDLARLQAGYIAIEARECDLARLVRQAVEDHRPAALAKRLTLAADLPGHLPVHADALRLRQVLDNLLSNAVKYTPDGGIVTVAAGPAAAADAGNPSVVLTVADTGIGIPAEQYGRLFERFFRASTAREAGVKGTGLGLAITKAIVTAHGGAITAAPGEGGGTVFTVILPVGPPTSS